MPTIAPAAMIQPRKLRRLNRARATSANSAASAERDSDSRVSTTAKPTTQYAQRRPIRPPLTNQATSTTPIRPNGRGEMILAVPGPAIATLIAYSPRPTVAATQNAREMISCAAAPRWCAMVAPIAMKSTAAT